MYVTITVDNGDGRTTRESLFDWLRREEVFRGHVQLRPVAVPPEKMGALGDVLVVALGAGGAGAVLARSLAEWLKQRTSDVRLTLKRPGGETISLDGRRIRDPEKLIASVTRFVDEHASDGDETA